MWIIIIFDGEAEKLVALNKRLVLWTIRKAAKLHLYIRIYWSHNINVHSDCNFIKLFEIPLHGDTSSFCAGQRAPYEVKHNKDFIFIEKISNLRYANL